MPRTLNSEEVGEMATGAGMRIAQSAANSIAWTTAPLAPALLAPCRERFPVRISVKSGEVIREFFIDNGAVVFARSLAANETLGAMLVRDGRITGDERKELLATAKQTNRRMGDLLVERNKISADELANYLDQQIRTMIENALKADGSQVAIIPGERARGESRVDPHATIVRWVTQTASPARLRQEMNVPDTASVTFTPTAAKRLVDLGLGDDWLTAAAVLENAASIARASQNGADTDQCVRILYLLWALGAVNLGPASDARPAAQPRPVPSMGLDVVPLPAATPSAPAISTPEAELAQILRQADTYLSAGRNVEAKRLLEPALSRFPAEAGLCIRMGDALAALGSPNAAEHYERASSLDPTEVRASLKLAELYLRTNHVPAARAAYREVLTFDPGNAEALRALATLDRQDVQPIGPPQSTTRQRPPAPVMSVVPSAPPVVLAPPAPASPPTAPVTLAPPTPVAAAPAHVPLDGPPEPRAPDLQAAATAPRATAIDEELLDKLLAADGTQPFAVLGVSPSAPLEQVRESAQRLRQRLSLDEPASGMTGRLRQAIKERVSAAERLAQDARARAAVQKLSVAGWMGPGSEAVLAEAHDRESAVAALVQGRFQEAFAATEGKTDAVLLTVRALAAARLASSGDKQWLERAHSAAKAATDSAPMFLDAWLILALAEKRAGNNDRAEAALAEIRRRDPSHPLPGADGPPVIKKGLGVGAAAGIAMVMLALGVAGGLFGSRLLGPPELPSNRQVAERDANDRALEAQKRGAELEKAAAAKAVTPTAPTDNAATSKVAGESGAAEQASADKAAADKAAADKAAADKAAADKAAADKAAADKAAADKAAVAEKRAADKAAAEKARAERAAAAAQKASEEASKPVDVEATLSQAENLLRSGKFDRALAAFRKVAKAAPDNAAAHRGLGMCLSMLGKDAEATKEYKLFLKLAPDSPDAAQIKALVEEAEQR